MSARISSDLLLVGSLPADSTEEALRSADAFFGDMVFALPDGETGGRSTWIGYERQTLMRPHPDVETTETTSPTGVPRHSYETPYFGLRPGVEQLHWGTWPRIDDAIESYELFCKLRDQGVIRQGLRFQIGLPFPASAMSSFTANFNHDYPIVSAAFEDLVARELVRLTEAIPPSDLAIQWDLARETMEIENVLAWAPEGGWERFAGPVNRLLPLIPEEALVGFHFCYGTFPEWPMYEPQDMSVVVRMSNYAIAESGRRVDWLHLAGPRHLRSEDKRFFRPLMDLDTSDTRLFLGIVLPLDGVEGLRRRYATASRYVDDFGVAMYCGFGRQPGQDSETTMREHRDTVLTVLGEVASRA